MSVTLTLEPLVMVPRLHSRVLLVVAQVPWGVLAEARSVSPAGSVSVSLLSVAFRAVVGDREGVGHLGPIDRGFRGDFVRHAEVGVVEGFDGGGGFVVGEFGVWLFGFDVGFVGQFARGVQREVAGERDFYAGAAGDRPEVAFQVPLVVVQLPWGGGGAGGGEPGGERVGELAYGRRCRGRGR